MLTEGHIISNRLGETVAIAEPAAARPRSVAGYLSGLGPFFAIVAQFALLVLVVDSWQLESQLLTRLLWLAFAGVIIHHLLPRRFRLSFFALLSVVAVITGVGHLGPNVFTGWITGKDDNS